MRIALLTESASVGTGSAEGGWCDRLTRELAEHEFELYALGSVRAGSAHAGTEPLPGRLSGLRRADPRPAVLHGRARRRALSAYRELLRSLVEPAAAEGFGPALYALAEAGRGGGLAALLRSGAALRLIETAWKAPGAVAVSGSGSAGEPLVRDALVAADLLANCLRALSAPWYDERRPEGLGAADLCHALGGGLAVLPGLLAKHFYGIPLIITEHSLHLRERARGYRDAPYRRPVRALMLTFFRLLAREAYRQAGLITPGSSFDQRWQVHCGADPATVRVVYEGTPGADLPAADAEPEVHTLVWIGPAEPYGGLETVLRAFARLRAEHEGVRLLVHSAPAGGSRAAEAGARHCRELAAELFPEQPEAVRFQAGDGSRGGAGRLRDAHEKGTVIVFSGTEGPRPMLVAEAMLSGRPVVATDVGAARELVGPTGLLVPAEDPEALAAACSALLRDPERRARLGNAGRLRAQELYAVEPAAVAFRDLYLELASRLPNAETPFGAPAARRPFGRTAEVRVAAESPVPASALAPPADPGAVTGRPRRAGAMLAELRRRAVRPGPEAPEQRRAPSPDPVPVGAGIGAGLGADFAEGSGVGTGAELVGALSGAEEAGAG
ncbi:MULTISPECIES: DUF3492 domain-containing protein [Streptacidiphilus]|uniref:D-inositol 3-phosphate glycosyltransferase n=1 Tax=Streptacidiphilus cavernicola TaxID=3342716 RepID=A0ABV6V0G3_9ACTN|nr:DUF3492 domain-containing protein [Streptacidiphilus jeojiense]